MTEVKKFPELQVADLRVRRAGKEVVSGVSIAVRPGQITALLGPNGAGKSSLVMAILGSLPVAAGEIRLGPLQLCGLSPTAIRRAGIAAAPEGHRVLTDLTVRDNLMVAGDFLGRSDLNHGVDEALAAFPELKVNLSQRAGTLSGGQQQMVVLGQAIVSRPRYLIADELSFGLAPIVVARLVPVLQAMTKKGIGILLIEQFTHIALEISDQAYVMERGSIVYKGSSAELKRNPEVLHGAYLASP